MPPNELELQGNGKEWSREWNRFPKTAPRIHRSVSFPGVMNLLLFSSHRRTFFFVASRREERRARCSTPLHGSPAGLKIATRYGLIRKCTWPIKASRLARLRSGSAVGKIRRVLPPVRVCNPFRAFTLST